MRTRKLYSDRDEAIFDATRLIVLNSIENLPTRGDFLDRCVMLNTARIDERARKTEEEFWASFERARPRILGALFSAVSVALRNLASVELDHYPRIADFVRWSVAAELGLGLEPDSFLRAYESNRARANSTALEAAPIAEPLLDLLDNDNGSWHGDFKQLLKCLGARVGEQVKASSRRAQAAEAGSLGTEYGEEAILIVEDDALVREYVMTQIGRFGYHTMAAGNAAEALAVIDGPEHVDLLFTDVIMPGGMNGRQLATEAQKRRPNLSALHVRLYRERHRAGITAGSTPACCCCQNPISVLISRG